MTIKRFLIIVLVVGTFSCSSKPAESGETEVQIEKPVEKVDNQDNSSSGNAPGIKSANMVERMGRGINIGNVLSAPIEGNWAPAITEDYIEDVAEAGFSTVRIPIRFDMHTTSFEEVNYTNASGEYIGSASNYEVDPNYLDRIEQVSSWALSYNMVAIIDVHGDHWFWESYKEDSEYYRTGNDLRAAEDRFKAIWRDISVRFQITEDNLLFEIMNEAYFSMNAEEVNYINQEILKIIRETNPVRNVIVTGGGKNSYEAPLQLQQSFLESDEHLIATFHYYKPFQFTSSSREGRDDFIWGSEEDKNKVIVHFDEVYDWSQVNDIPVFLGEFGADNEGGYDYNNNTYGSYGGPDQNSRVEYYGFLAEAALERGFSFAAWDAGHKSNKTIYIAPSRSWVEEVKTTLVE